MFKQLVSVLLLTSFLVVALGEGTDPGHADDTSLTDDKKIENLANEKETQEPTDSDPDNQDQTGPINDVGQNVPQNITGKGTTATPIVKSDTKHPATSDINESGVKDQMHNCTIEGNSTYCKDQSKENNYFKSLMSDNKDMLTRTFYVLISITGIIVVYFVIRTIRSRRRQSRTKRYGLLSNRDDNLEMRPLDSDEDDEDDLTVFDINNRK